jgi:hypothetical protein
MTTTITPALGQGATMNQATSYDAISARRAWTGFERGEGVATYGSFRVSQRGAGANMSVDIAMDDFAWVRGDAVTHQGLYQVAPHSATINETITTAHATLPRLDQVVLEVKDHAHDASGSSLAQTRVVNGTATSGATLDNRNGAASLPASALLLADVLVAAADASISDAEIRDRRVFSAPGVVPPLLTDVDMVAFQPFLGLTLSDDASDMIETGVHTNDQAACLMYLPRRIAAATRIRWRYRHSSGTPASGNYVIGIYDASGRKLIDTGSVAFTGAAGTIQQRSETITATTFEPGYYYVLIGVDALLGSVSAYNGVELAVKSYATERRTIGPPHANVALRSDTGGVTAPTTLLAMTDLAGQTTPTVNVLAVPIVALSVG